MCYYPQLIPNPKYKKTKKNGGIIPPITDKRVLYVPVGCKKCKECKRQKAREWQTRMLEDIKTHKNGHFIALTFSNEAYEEIYHIQKEKGYKDYDLDNAIAAYAVRHWLERWRKQHKKSVRHWLITELGHNNTEHIHIHGIIWTDKPKEVLEKWTYGHTWKGDYVNEATINYIIKYVTKADLQHPNYMADILTSPGIGHNYTNTLNASKNKYRSNATKETYKTKSGHEMAMPNYWRNKIYTEEEREKLWLEKLDKDTRYVSGVKIKNVSTEKGEREYWQRLEQARKENARLGYGGQEQTWEQLEYEKQLRNIKQLERINKKNKH